MSEEEDDIIPEIKNTTFEEKPKITKLQGLFENWFLEYASYVILERAVPHIYDGLKPVQRRILHSMKEKEDGRYNKVANLVGHTMQYHPHGDASIGDALVQMGQKNLLIDTQGNWGNILTGDSAAAPRYIEARLTKFALEVVFNYKTTNWQSSYDGRNKEPETLPVKFPLLLASGAEGIAVGLSSKILPHNFIEILDACIDTLQDKPVQLFPDFPTGGLADCSKYNDGQRGGRVLVRAKIEKNDKKTLTIREIPFGQTTDSVIESIIKANNNNKIKIKKIDDITAENIEISIQLQPGISPDLTIDALYACTNCQVSIATYACVIEDDKPFFASVQELLQHSVHNTVQLLKKELQIEKQELEDQWQGLSLEKWFIEKRIYKEKEYENAKSTDYALKFINDKTIEDKLHFIREITKDDLLKLLEIKMKRILKFNIDKANDELIAIEEQIKKVEHDLNNLIEYSINYYKHLKEKYGKGRERKTELRNFDTIDETKVVLANEKLYANYKEGFVGTDLRKDIDAQFVCDCSDIDDIIIFRRDGKYTISKVSGKAFFGKDIIYANVFVKNDKRTIYNAVYRDGKSSISYIKRFAVYGITRDKEYDLSKAEQGSKLLYFSANPNGEAEVIKVFLKPKPKLRKLVFEQNFKDISIKGRDSQGNIIARSDIHKIVLKEEGVSTLGGRKIWFDQEVYRLNADNRGLFLGEFSGDDKILVIYNDGLMQITNFDLSNHYDENIKIIEKFDVQKVFSVIYFDAEQNFAYLKRFQIEESAKAQYIISESEGSSLIDISDDKFPIVQIVFGGKHKSRELEIINAEQFIGIKGITAKGKRLTTFEYETIKFDEPLQKKIEEEIDNDRNDDDDKNDNIDDFFETDKVVEQSLF
ncbi:MAG: DNA gyrase/topoisomerase IV subunit A [Bacteroidales bacterium]|jgi:topoisomerase-4 subunit A|nr:DNA gyrase/topoisomerase IV subunit A [Bacteroidales bacterium]